MGQPPTTTPSAQVTPKREDLSVTRSSVTRSTVTLSTRKPKVGGYAERGSLPCLRVLIYGS